jgi:hypothetical protein
VFTERIRSAHRELPRDLLTTLYNTGRQGPQAAQPVIRSPKCGETRWGFTLHSHSPPANLTPLMARR